MTKLQAGILGAFALAGVVLFLVLQQQTRSAMLEKDELLRQQSEQLAQLAADNERMSNQLAQANSPAAQSQFRDLLRLRGEVVNLKKQLAEVLPGRQSRAQSVQTPPEPDPVEQQKERVKELAIAKMNFTKGWMLAFMEYAKQRGGQLPARFEDAQAFLPETTRNQTNLVTEQFEIVYQGSLAELENPASTIIIREKEPWLTLNGVWVKGYGFADGHSEMHRAPDGDFETWEAQHMVAPASTEEPAQ